MTPDEAMIQMTDAGLSDRIKGQALRLLDLFNQDKTEDQARLIETFRALANNENLTHKDAVTTARVNQDALAPWQKHLFACMPESEFVPLPEYARTQSAMWRFATWEAFASDTVHCYGPMAATVLSMVYKPRVVVEMGIHGGLTTLLLCKLNPQARVYGIDVNSKVPGTTLPIGFAAWNAGVKNLTIEIMNSWDFSFLGLVDLCFIDGDHTGDAPYNDSLRAWANRSARGDWCIAWDDYNPNNPAVYDGVNKFVSEVGMPLWTVNSWVFIGTKGPDHFKELI